MARLEPTAARTSKTEAVSVAATTWRKKTKIMVQNMTDLNAIEVAEKVLDTRFGEFSSEEQLAFDTLINIAKEACGILKRQPTPVRYSPANGL